MTEETETPILTKIQNELKAPKNQNNDFGHYKYRNAEDIEKALKPILLKYGATLYITEDVKQVGGRIYFVDTAHYKDIQDKIEVQGWAREAENKKGMDSSQVSGATSSYAIKYALGKLFLIDDTRDADSPSQERREQNTLYKKKQSSRQAPVPVKQLSTEQLKNYTVTAGGKPYKVFDIFKQAVTGNQNSQAFIKKLSQLGGQNKRVVDELTKLYKSLKKAKPAAVPAPEPVPTSDPNFDNPVNPFDNI